MVVGRDVEGDPDDGDGEGDPDGGDGKGRGGRSRRWHGGTGREIPTEVTRREISTVAGGWVDGDRLLLRLLVVALGMPAIAQVAP